MKTTNILNQLGILPTKQNKVHVNTLIQILKALTELKPKFKHVQRSPAGMFNFGVESREYSRGYSQPYERSIINEGEPVLSECFIIKTDTGTYKQIIPVNNDLHCAFCELIGQPVNEVKETPLFSFTFSKKETDTIKRAAKIKSKYSYNDWNGIFNLTFAPGKCTVQITDGFRCFSETLKNIGIDQEKTLFVNSENLTGISGELTVSIFADHYKLNGLKFNFVDINREYPNFTNLWPLNTDYITVNKKEVVSALKQAAKISNQISKKVTFEFNGCLKVTAKDEDFGRDLDLRIDYNDKKGIDMAMNFNAGYLLDLLGILDTENITIQYPPVPNKPVVINDTILLMPAMNTQ